MAQTLDISFEKMYILKQCCLFIAKQLPEPILTYCWLDPPGTNSIKEIFINIQIFHGKKRHL